jgi:hypothetical protein
MIDGMAGTDRPATSSPPPLSSSSSSSSLGALSLVGEYRASS